MGLHFFLDTPWLLCYRRLIRKLLITKHLRARAARGLSAWLSVTYAGQIQTIRQGISIAEKGIRICTKSNIFFPYLVYVVSVILIKSQVRLQLTNTLGNLSPYFVLVFSSKSQNMVCAFHVDYCVCIRVKEWQAFSSDRVSVNVCCECFIFNHIFNLKNFFIKVKEKV